MNGLSDKVSVVHRDAALLERGREAPRTGVNLVVADMFDAGVSHSHAHCSSSNCLWL